MKNRDDTRSFPKQIGSGHQMSVKAPRSVFGVVSIGVMRADIFWRSIRWRADPTVFTRPVFEVRQARQDGGGNIYMAHIYALVATQNVLHNLHTSFTESGFIDMTLPSDDAGSAGTCRHWPDGKKTSRNEQKQSSGPEKENGNVISRIWWKWSGKWLAGCVWMEVETQFDCRAFS